MTVQERQASVSLAVARVVYLASMTASIGITILSLLQATLGVMP